MSDLRPEDVFAVNSNIRWAGLATAKGEVIFSQMRPGVKSITPEQDDRLLLELRAQYITETSQRASRWAGSVEYIAVSYEKFMELIIILKERYVVVTLEKNVTTQALPEITKSVQNLNMEKRSA